VLVSEVTMKSVAVAVFLVALSGRLSVVNETGKLSGVCN